MDALVHHGRAALPRLRAPDSSLALRREGYRFISRRCDRLGTDGFRTRLMLSPVTCLRGADAARVVYGSGCFSRERAVPRPTLRLLQDIGSVQTLEGKAHRCRKAMFLGMMSPESLARARDIFASELQAALPRWTAADRVELLPEIETVLTRTSCTWAGVPLAEADFPARTREFSAMIDRSADLGPRHLWARLLRNRSERWARSVVADARTRMIAAPPGSALALLAEHRDAGGRQLDLAVAAVELINVLRPTVAVARFVVFAAHALATEPQAAASLAEDDALEPFVLEVRRFYPFFPAIGARATAPAEWRGHRFAPGDWVLLDLFGTNRHPELWQDPDRFRPERFRAWPGDPFTLVPQGGGPFETDHRCPGEWLTIALVAEAVRFLTRSVRYEVPPQDLTIDLARMPAQPRSGMVLRGLRAA